MGATSEPRGAIAFFDLDGTLVVGQTQQLLVSFLRRRGVVGTWYLLGVGLWFGAYKLGIVSATDKARARGAELIAGWGVAEVDSLMDDFTAEELVPRLYAPTLAELATRRASGDHVVMLSAALEPLVASLARHLEVPAWEGTRLEREGDRYTGRIEGRALYGPEKAAIARRYLGELAVDAAACSAYADHESDVELLRLVGTAVAVRPRQRLREVALAEGWRVIA